MAKTTFFITGATGLLGTEVVGHLLAMTDGKLYVLQRAASTAEAAYRLQSLWDGDSQLTTAIGKRIIPVLGDITSKEVTTDRQLREELLDTVTHVIHCAAETGVQKSKDDLWRINVEGTRNIVRMAGQMSRLQRYVHISTAYVAGTRSGKIDEDTMPATRFYSLYEQSKAEAENIVRASSLPFTVCRPGMIVGNSKTGRTRNFNTVYYVLKLMLRNRLPFLPVSANQTVNVIPADYVARMVATVTLQPQAEGQTFHLTLPAAQLPKVGELADEVRTWAKENLNISIRKPCCIPLPFLRFIGKHYNAGKQAKSRNLLSNLTALMPYFLDDHTFDRSHTDRLTGCYADDWHRYLPTLLTFACRHNFMRISDNNIFEQAVIRRRSSHYPITYYDITAHGTETVSGKEMNRMVERYIRQLHELGVKSGDTVALTGINCAEHAAIDNAIGLVGATSVPIYYTTPGDEMELLMKKSGARWFFVGDERAMKNAETITDIVTIIPFGPIASKEHNREARPAKEDLHREARPTKEDLHREARPTVVPSAAVNPHSVATIRYTSGTTGEPKGVMFSFSQLKWMGEVLTNLLPWRERNSEMRYLSFLPMSHVVEGILAAYAPYCMLCKAKIYYLNDFQMLTIALPRVRPTVFFSVPRFYEKLWEQIAGNTLGRRYLKMSEGNMKRLTGRVLRWAVMRKAGLNRCSQLIVGSAPISEELLMRFRRLGIEIYNAYGQTEAPLITINRLGHNTIPSIGTPLPDTTVSIAADGELVVEGPQVALGYHQLQSDTFRNGQLFTGDLGHIDNKGNVYVKGRKKDMLITSYGKNINCSKIEQRLTDIDCVEHAVLVGEQRPYCAALLWTNGSTDSLQRDIDRMNATLSHPEQVKRWLIIETPLSIKGGELTPNLKVKRNVVTEHYSSEIERLYNHPC